MKDLMAYLVARGKEASTWRGLILVVTALTGWQVSPEKAQAIALLGLFAAGAVGSFFPDKPKDPP